MEGAHGAQPTLLNYEGFGGLSLLLRTYSWLDKFFNYAFAKGGEREYLLLSKEECCNPMMVFSFLYTLPNAVVTSELFS